MRCEWDVNTVHACPPLGQCSLFSSQPAPRRRRHNAFQCEGRCLSRGLSLGGEGGGFLPSLVLGQDLATVWLAGASLQHTQSSIAGGQSWKVALSGYPIPSFPIPLASRKNGRARRNQWGARCCRAHARMYHRRAAGRWYKFRAQELLTYSPAGPGRHGNPGGIGRVIWVSVPGKPIVAEEARTQEAGTAWNYSFRGPLGPLCKIP